MMARNRWLEIVVGAALMSVAVVTIGCGSEDGTSDAPDTDRSETVVVVDLPDEPDARVRARTAIRFGRAAQLMPGNLQPDHLPSDLAPLLLVREDVEGAWGVRTAEGMTVSEVPVLVHGETHAILGGVRHRQFHYQWWHRPPDGSWRSQGVRMTVDDDGQPLVWEQLAAPSGLRVLYVSEALESRARRQYGDPLPGRAFAVERAPDVTPTTVVARALADGPVPMGPWVYLDQPTDVTSLICRCMPSQVRGPLERTDYRLRAWEPFDAAGVGWVQERVEDPPEKRLEGWLRWPR